MGMSFVGISIIDDIFPLIEKKCMEPLFTSHGFTMDEFMKETKMHFVRPISFSQNGIK